MDLFRPSFRFFSSCSESRRTYSAKIWTERAVSEARDQDVEKTLTCQQVKTDSPLKFRKASTRWQGRRSGMARNIAMSWLVPSADHSSDAVVVLIFLFSSESLDCEVVAH